jgi:hypothetical protein
MDTEVETMTTLMLDLSPELYERLREEAVAMGDTVQGAAQKFLGERLNVLPHRHKARNERERLLKPCVLQVC